MRSDIIHFEPNAITESVVKHRAIRISVEFRWTTKMDFDGQAKVITLFQDDEVMKNCH
jgi:hypothetical protein